METLEWVLTGTWFVTFAMLCYSNCVIVRQARIIQDQKELLNRPTHTQLRRRTD
jgi:hypothetical protein